MIKNTRTIICSLLNYATINIKHLSKSLQENLTGYHYLEYHITHFIVKHHNNLALCFLHASNDRMYIYLLADGFKRSSPIISVFTIEDAGSNNSLIKIVFRLPPSRR